MSIIVQGTTKLYGKQKALDNVSFSINTGEIVGFLGPNGAGKSTMMKIITGFIPATEGKVLVNNLDIEDNSLQVKKIIGYLPENNPLYPEMYVREYLLFVASIYDKTITRTNRINEIIELTGLSPEQNKKIGALSKGYRQRVGLAQALINDPDVLILDEPTTGLDPNQIVEIRSLIKEVGRDKTVMLSTHIMQEVEAICDRIIIIDKGTIVADKNKADIYSLMNSSRQIVKVEFDNDINEGLINNIENVVSGKRLKGNIWIIESNGDKDIRPLIFNMAVNNNLTVLSLQKQENNLEEVFRHLTSV
jgi:ABC-2 type transport system ATP-binding protein